MLYSDANQVFCLYKAVIDGCVWLKLFHFSLLFLTIIENKIEAGKRVIAVMKFELFGQRVHITVLWPVCASKSGTVCVLTICKMGTKMMLSLGSTDKAHGAARVFVPMHVSCRLGCNSVCFPSTSAATQSLLCGSLLCATYFLWKNLLMNAIKKRY